MFSGGNCGLWMVGFCIGSGLPFLFLAFVLVLLSCVGRAY